MLHNWTVAHIIHAITTRARLISRLLGRSDSDIYKGYSSSSYSVWLARYYYIAGVTLQHCSMMWLRLQQRRRGPAAAAGLVQWCSFQQAAVSTSPPPAARPRPGQMIAIFLKMNKIPTDGSTFSRFIWDESRSWVAGGGQGWTLPVSGALLRHGHTRHTQTPGSLAWAADLTSCLSSSSHLFFPRKWKSETLIIG